MKDGANEIKEMSKKQQVVGCLKARYIGVEHYLHCMCLQAEEVTEGREQSTTEVQVRMLNVSGPETFS